jgi:hypothetical protein
VTFWFGLLVVGAALNSLEFAVFERAHLAKMYVGLVLASWGIGGAIAFALATNPSKNRLVVLTAVMWLSFWVFAFSESWVLLAIALLVAGMSNTTLTGATQTAIQFAIPKDVDERMVWAKLHRCMAVTNLTITAAIGALLDSPFQRSTVILTLPGASALLFGCALLIYPRVRRRQAAPKEQD